MRIESFKGALLSALILASLVTLVLVLPSVSSVSPASAEPDQTIIVHEENTYSRNQTEDSLQRGYEPNDSSYMAVMEKAGLTRIEPQLGKLSENIQRELERERENEIIRIIMRLEPADLRDVPKNMAVKRLKEHANRTQRPVIEFLQTRGARVLNKFWLANAILAEVNAGTIYELIYLPNVWRIHEDFEVPIFDPIESSISLQTGITWGLNRIGAPDVWALGIDGSGVRVAVLDTGVDATHPDLVGKIWTDNLDDPTFPGGWIEFDSNGNIVVGSTPHDTYGHGTHTSGTVLGDNASGTAIGVAPGATLMHGLIDLTGAYYSSWIAGMEWTLSPHDQYGNPAGAPADVVSMSWGDYGYWSEMIEPITNMKLAGVVPVVSIGNDGEGTSASPGNVYEAFGIGAMDVYDNVPSWSSGEVVYKTGWPDPPADWPNSYIKPDFSAPGVDVYSSVPGGWNYSSGTSMAAPHVAGTIALMLESNPALTVDDIYDALKLTSSDLGAPGKDTRYGWGVINAFDATILVRSNSGVQGYVVDALTSEGIAGAKVTIQETGWVRHTAENGYYRIFASPDNYTLAVSAFGYCDNTAAASVVENQWTTLNIALAPLPTGSISGEVTDDAFNPIENAVISLLGTPLSARTDNTGSYILEAPIDNYDVEALAWGHRPAFAYDVEILENQITTVNFQLEPARFVLWDDTKDTDGDSLTGNYLYLYQLLTDNGFAVDELTTGPINYGVLNNYDILVLIDPELDFSSSEIADIQNWVWAGGALIIIPNGGYPPTLNTLMAPYGVQMTGRTGGYGITTDTVSHPITQDVDAIYVDWVREISVISPSTCLAWVMELSERYAFLSVTDGGEVVVISDSNIMDNPGIGMAGNAQLMLNIFNYVGIKPEHELSVTLEAPTFLEPGTSFLLEATVYNRGLENENNVELQLLIENTIVDSVIIPELPAGTSYTLSYMWTPTVEGTYEVKAYAPPVPDEGYTGNNIVSKTVDVQILPDILIVADNDASSWIRGTSLPEFESALIAADYDYSVWKESTMGRPSLEFLTKFELVIWTCGDYWNWAVDPTDAEMLEVYLAQGGNILLEGEDIGYDHYADDFMVNVAHAIMQRDGTGALGLTVTDLTHPVTQGLPTTFSWLQMPPYDDGVAPTNGGFEVIQYTGTPWTAVTVFDGEGTGYGSVVYYAFPIYCLWQSERDTLVINSVRWLIPQEHDIAVTLEAPTFLELGTSFLLEATVYNRGLDNEENVELQLLIDNTIVDSVIIPELLTGSSYTLSYLWTPTVEGTYDVTAYAPPVPDEEYTGNNVATKTVEVRPIKGYVLFDQTHGTDGIEYYGIWVDNLIERDYVIETHTSGPITPAVLDGYDVFVIPQAHYDYTSDELYAIENFVLDGGGLLVIGDDYPSIYTSLTSFAGITWASGGYGGYTSDITPHPVTEGVTTAYFAVPLTELYVAFPAEDLIRDDYGCIMLAVSEWPGKVMGIADEQSISDGYIGYADDLRLANNMIDWLAAPPPPFGIFVSISPKYQSGLPGATLEYTVMVKNIGMFEDTYDLSVSDDAGWSPALLDNLLENVQPGEDRTVTLSVTIPIDPASWTSTIIVTAVSRNDPMVSASANCIAKCIVTYVKSNPSYEWAPRISSTSVASCDDIGTWVDLPFEFPFWSDPKTRVYVCSNGFLIFDPTPATNDYTNSLEEFKTRWMISPFWDDLVTCAGGGIVSEPGVYVDNYSPAANADRVVITWEAIRYWEPADSIKFQVILYDDGDIRINVNNATNFWNFSPTLGISKGDGIWYFDITDERGTDKSWLFSLIPLVIPATVDIDSDTINLKSMDNWITAYIELPEGYNVENIDVGTVRLIVDNDNVPAEAWPTEIGDHDNDSIPDLMVKFSWSAVLAIVNAGEVEMTVVGEVGGVPFEGSDNVRVTSHNPMGWNLIGFTAVGDNDTPTDIFSGLDYYTDYYLYWYLAPGGPYQLQGPSQVLKDNLGYWIWINQSWTVLSSGTPPSSRDIYLENGWNLVSFPVVNGSTTPNNIFTGLDYYADYYIYYYIPPGGPYGLQGPDEVLKDNLGYWVWINQDKTVTVP